jgi:hypothetical protein
MNCALCQKEVEADDLTWIFTTVGATEEQAEHQEEFGYCQDCKIFFESHKSTFHVIDGPSYSDDDRPPFWYNDAPLDYEHYHVAHGQIPYLHNELMYIDLEKYLYFMKANVLDTEQLPLDAFPLIEDFEIRLERLTMRYESGKEHISDVFVWLFSQLRGYLAHIREHDSHKDLSRPDFIIPHGDFQTPYADLDQGWDILLAEDDVFVYVLTGNWEVKEGYRTWFKVEKALYYRQWERAIQRCREIGNEDLPDE